MADFHVPDGAKGIPWSFSSIKMFESCPHRYQKVRVEKAFKGDFSSPALERGKAVHQKLAHFILDPDAQPAFEHQWLWKLASWARNNLRDIDAEVKLCLDNKLRHTEWFSKSAWCRTAADVFGFDKDGVVSIVDWKTGRHRPSDQPGITAAIWMASNPTIEAITTRWIWVDPVRDGERPIIERKEWTRESALEVWNRFMETLCRINEMQRGITTWAKTPCGDCRWCEVASCPLQGKDF